MLYSLLVTPIVDREFGSIPHLESVGETSILNNAKRSLESLRKKAAILAIALLAQFWPNAAVAAEPVITGALPLAQLSDQVQLSSEGWQLYGQLTHVVQKHPQFRSPYSGDNSLSARGRAEETTDLTLFLGRRLGRNTEFWINPEIDQGFGLNNTLGAAGFPSGAAYKLGANTPYYRIPRAFIRHVTPLGGEELPIDSAANQAPGKTTADNITFTVGKFAAVDIFDTNRYAHDPRADFLNWSVLDSGAFDYAADSWGYTYGAAAEWNQGWWTFRGGLFQLSKLPNGKVAGLHLRQRMLVTEFETRYQWLGHPGKVRLLGFVNRANMASYRDALQLAVAAGGPPDVSQVRRLQTRPGFAVSLEQELATDVGAFLRLSANDGRKEAYEFTEISKSLAVGLSWKGNRWGRAEDTFGLAAVVNALSSDAQAYFAAGGLGILIGDGGQTYARERIVETYYAMRLHSNVTASLNFQRIANPAHNSDRGPVSIWGLRLHVEY